MIHLFTAFAPMLAQANAIPGLDSLLQFLQTVAVLVGLCLILYGAWQIHQGHVSHGVLSLIAGFIAVITIPLVRLMAGWSGFNL